MAKKARGSNGRLAATLAALFLGGCGVCGNDVVKSTPSPDGRWSAVLFQRDCGATTGFSTQISVVRRGGEPAGGGNIFVADDDHGAAPTAAWGGPWADVKWSSPTTLTVFYDGRSRLFAKRERIVDVHISYAPSSPSGRATAIPTPTPVTGRSPTTSRPAGQTPRR